MDNQVDLDALDALHAAAGLSELFSTHIVNDGYTHLANLTMAPDKPCFCIMHRKQVVDWFAANHNAYPAIAAELRALRGNVEVLEAEAKQHDYDLTQTINERDEMEERVNAIAVALLLPEPEQEWTSANDVGERCVEAAEALREERDELRARVAELEAANGN